MSKRALGVAITFSAACGPMYKSGDPPPPAATPGPPGGAPDMAPQVSAAPTAMPPRPTASAAAGLSGAAKQFVEAHNRYRARHCAEPFTWSPALAAVAQSWADTLKANNCGFDHSNGKYGENLAAATIGALTPESVVTMWYDELKGYSFKQPGFSMQTGHFTQVVWRGTKQVGCGSAQCNGLEIWVCEYDPPGNWHGQYREHVLPLGCE